MSTTLTKTSPAVEYFKAKLEFEVGPVELKAILERGEPIQVVDLRTADLYKEAHIPKSIQADFNQFEQFITGLDKDVTTVVYCYNITCHLSTKAALYLAERGYKVRELAGGWDKWVEAGFETQAGAKSSSCSTAGGGCA